MTISYKHSREAWANYHQFLTDLIVANQFKRICEIGGGANPAISLDFIKKHHIEYTVLDINSRELAKAPDGYQKVVGDITTKNMRHLNERYDFVFSKMLAEHIQDAESFHRNVYKILSPGGMAFHFFPTLFSLPFIINKLLPEKISYQILKLMAKERDNAGDQGKFPAYYAMCRGSTQKQMNKLKSIGYHIESYINFFGHEYFRKIPPLNYLSQKIANLLLKFRMVHLTSFSYLILRKPINQ